MKCKCGNEAIGRESDGYTIIYVCEEHAWEGLAKAKAGEHAYGMNVWWERFPVEGEPMIPSRLNAFLQSEKVNGRD